MRVRPSPALTRRELLAGAAAGAGAWALLAACGIDDPGQELRGAAPGTLPDAAVLRPAVAGSNAFAIDLFRALCARDGGNVVIGPTAVAASLAIARLGAGSATREEFDRVLHAPELGNPATAFVTLAALLTGRSGDRSNARRTGRVELRPLHALWAPRGAALAQAYLDRVATELDTGVRVIDFRSGAEVARAAMNRWAADATGGAVTNLVPKGSVSEFTSLVSTSALHVQAPWAQQFDRARTRPAPFTRIDGTTTEPPMMALAASRNVLVGTDADPDGLLVVDLPYLGDELTLVLLVPPAGAIDPFVAALDRPGLGRAIQSLTPASREIRVPRFGFTSALRLDDALRDLGLVRAFSGVDGDLTTMTADDDVALTTALQQTWFGIDEEGTSATAATVTKDAPTTSPERVVTVDRPFVFVLRDRATNLVVAIGRVHDPTAV